MDFSTYTYTAADISQRLDVIKNRLTNNVLQKEILQTLLSVLDLTTLNGNDNAATISNLCKKAVSFASLGNNFPNVAAVCVYPPFVRQAKELLAGTPISVASVAGAFPSGQSPIHVKTAEVSYCVAEGADEIDMVISRGTFLEGNFRIVSEEIAAIKKACGQAHLKVILETGELLTIENIRKASEIAILAGGDFIKTSTGKINPAATPEAMMVMCDTIHEFYKNTGIKIGIKPAGAIADTHTALFYYAIVEEILGHEWLNKSLFRIGASRLADDIVVELNKL